MTPQEKAKDIYDKMFGKTPIRQDKKLAQLDKHTSKQHTLICVDEILEFNKKSYQLGRSGVESYWKEVKNEIQKL